MVIPLNYKMSDVHVTYLNHIPALRKQLRPCIVDLAHVTVAGDYVNFVTISIWDEMFGLVLACVVFVSTIKFIKV